ncbi:MAG: hypothetical protein ACHQF2_06070 [Flavobacteriales bacterium]
MIENTIDKSDSSGQKVFSFKSGRLAGDSAIGVAIVLIAAGIFGFPYATVAWIPAAYLIFTTHGIKFDVPKNKLMEYTKHFGLFTTGSWKTNNIYNQIAIMGSRTTYAGRVGFLTTAFYKSNNINVVLLDKYHVKRITICEADTVEEAEIIAESLYEKTGFPLVKFNPVKLTKQRRR